MKININIDDRLLNNAKEITGIKDNKAIIERALQLLVANENQKGLLELWGKVEIDNEAYK